MEMNHFETTDIALTTYLSSMGIIIKEIRGHGAALRRRIFIFESKKDLQKEVDKFYSKKARVEPMQYYQELKLVKSRLYQTQL